MTMLKYLCIFITGILIGIKCREIEQDKLLVNTKLGNIRGLKSEDGDYIMFLGIPYALVNSSNPFGDAINHPKLNDTFQAFDDTVICPQIEEFSKKFRGTLDCLRLNIYIPNKRLQSKLPILFYIHGGNFKDGNGGRNMYGPKYLVRHDIIFVIPNYRLGPYGYMCTDTPEVPGNQALKDQYMALEWVKNNIASFGGDPNKITLTGHSSGAISVDFHMMSKRPRLFQQAIVQSASAFYPNSTTPLDNTIPIKIAEKLSYKTNNVSKAISFLIRQNPEQVIEASKNLNIVTCIEKHNVGNSRIVFEYPTKSGAPNVFDINILAGYTKNEWLIALYSDTFNYKFYPQTIRNSLNLVFHMEHLEDMVKDVRHFYFDDKPMDNTTKYDLIDFFNDFEIIYPIHRSIKKYQNHRNVNIFMYYFIYSGKRNFMKRMYNMVEKEACHADELSYLFDVSMFKEEPSPEDSIMIDRMTTLWTNFIKYGNPTPSTTELIPVQWPQYTQHERNFLQINSTLSIVHLPFPRSMAFWDSVFNKNKQKY